jgi:hypothetical protein
VVGEPGVVKMESVGCDTVCSTGPTGTVVGTTGGTRTDGCFGTAGPVAGAGPVVRIAMGPGGVDPSFHCVATVVMKNIAAPARIAAAIFTTRSPSGR